MSAIMVEQQSKKSQQSQQSQRTRYPNLYEFIAQSGPGPETDLDENVNTFQSFIEIHWTTNKYAHLYVSFGSKWNGPEQVFETSDPSKNTITRTNASYQMVPQYLRETIPMTSLIDEPKQDRSNSKNLVIVVDVFSNADLLEENRRQLRNLAEHYPELDIIVLDCKLVKKTLKIVVECLLEKAVMYGMLGEQVMFCNYIRFSRPNALESKIEDLVPKNIQILLDQLVGGRYQTRFYQWYGPIFYMYNWVYNYKSYNLLMMRQYIYLLKICKHTLGDMQLSTDNLFLVEMQLDDFAGRNGTFMWRDFCRFSVDIKGTAGSLKIPPF